MREKEGEKVESISHVLLEECAEKGKNYSLLNILHHHLICIVCVGFSWFFKIVVFGRVWY